jgi:hypothetical protein
MRELNTYRSFRQVEFLSDLEVGCGIELAAVRGLKQSFPRFIDEEGSFSIPAPYKRSKFQTRFPYLSLTASGLLFVKSQYKMGSGQLPYA